MSTIIFVSIFLHFQIQLISGYSSGAPKEACITLSPNHDGVASQALPSTHRFEVSKAHNTYFAGEKIPIVLSVENTDTDAGFKGFIIQVCCSSFGSSTLGQKIKKVQAKKTREIK